MPLYQFLMILVKYRSESKWSRRRKCGLPTFEGILQSVPQYTPIEREQSGNQPYIIKVLHPAVCEAEFDYRFQFFGNQRISWIRLQERWRMIKEHRIFDIFRGWRYRIPKAESIWMGIRA